MYFLLYLAALIIIYVKSFKNDFTQEKIEKVYPVLILLAIVAFALSVIASITNSN